MEIIMFRGRYQGKGNWTAHQDLNRRIEENGFSTFFNDSKIIFGQQIDPKHEKLDAKYRL